MKDQLKKARFEKRKKEILRKLKKAYPDRGWNLSVYSNLGPPSFCVDDKSNKGTKVTFTGDVHSFDHVTYIRKNTTLKQAIKDVE